MDPIAALSCPFTVRPSAPIRLFDSKISIPAPSVALPKAEKFRIGYTSSELSFEEAKAIKSLQLSDNELTSFKEFLEVDLSRPAAHQAAENPSAQNAPKTPLEFIFRQQELIQSNELRTTREVAHSSLSEAKLSRQNYESCWLPSLLSNSTAQAEHGAKMSEAFHNAYRDKEYRLKTSLERSTRALCFAEAFRKLALSSPDKSEQLQTLAAKFYTQASQELFDTPKANFNVAQREMSLTLDYSRRATANWERAETVTRYARNTSVVLAAGTAAAIAAPVVFTSCTAVGLSSGSAFLVTSAAGGAVGGGTGFVLGGTTAALENTGCVMLELKTGEQALSDTVQQTIADTKKSAIAGVSSGAAGGVSSILNPTGAALPPIQHVKNMGLSQASGKLITLPLHILEYIR